MLDEKDVHARRHRPRSQDSAGGTARAHRKRRGRSRSREDGGQRSRISPTRSTRSFRSPGSDAPDAEPEKNRTGAHWPNRWSRNSRTWASPVTLDSGRPRGRPSAPDVAEARAAQSDHQCFALCRNGARHHSARRTAMAVLRVDDDGPGIPADRIQDMLEPFTRGEASRNRETGGVGIGSHAGAGRGRTARRRAGRSATGAEGGLRAEFRIPV